ncbi:MAG: hypothetical protein ACE5LU_22865 [Anaerolineae bacterium]
MNSQRTDGLTDWLAASVSLVASNRAFLVVPIVFDLLALILWSGLSWLLLDHVQLPAPAGNGIPVRLGLIQALPSTNMIVQPGRQVAVGDPPRAVAVFVLATLAIAALRAYGMAGFVGWLDRAQLIRGADLDASTFHLLGRRFFGPIVGYTLFWAAFSFLSIPVATTPVASFLFSVTKVVVGVVLMFTPYAILRHTIYTLDAMVASVDFVWRNRGLVVGLALIGFLATAAGSYVARSAMGLLGVAGYLISVMLWAPIGCVLSAVAYSMYLGCEEEI